MRLWPFIALFVLFLNFTHAQSFDFQSSNVKIHHDRALFFSLESLVNSATRHRYIGDSIYFPIKINRSSYPYNLVNNFLNTHTKLGVRVRDLTHNLAHKANEELYYKFSYLEQQIMQQADSQISFAYRPTALFNEHFYKYDVFTAYASIQHEWFTIMAIDDSIVLGGDGHFLLIKLSDADGSVFVWSVSIYQLASYSLYLGSELNSLSEHYLGKPVYIDTAAIPKLYSDLDSQWYESQNFYGAQCMGIAFVERPWSSHAIPVLQIEGQNGQHAYLNMVPFPETSCPILQWKLLVDAPKIEELPVSEPLYSSKIGYHIKSNPRAPNPFYVRKYGKSIAYNIMLHRVVLGMSSTTCSLSWGKPLYKTYVVAMGIETQLWHYSNHEWLSFKEGVLVGFKARQ